MHLGAGEEQAAILRGRHAMLDRRVEARPAGAALEFGLGAKERQAAGGADELAVPVLVVEGAAVGALRPVLAQHAELLWGQEGPPFRLGLHLRSPTVRR